MSDLVKSLDYKGFNIEVRYETDPENPRDWDNLGEIHSWHSRYNLGDVQHKTFESAKNAAKKNLRGNFIFPLYIYDHSGICLSLSPFSCPWDSGHVGFIKVSRDKIKENLGYTRITKKRKEQIKDILRSEIDAYNGWLVGSVFYYVIQDTSMEILDSCGGLYSLGEAISMAEEYVDCLLSKEKVNENCGSVS